MHSIPRYIEQLKQVLDQLPAQAIADLIAVLLHVRESGKTVFFMGNGGSAATASHFATDLGKGTVAPGRPRFKVMALYDCLPTFSAHANDLGYETVFAEPLRTFVARGDVVIGLSTSGKSHNVLEAMKVARAAGAVCVGFTGFDGGLLKDPVDLNLRVPSDHIGQIEDAHHIMMYPICDIIRQQPRDAEYALPSWAVRAD